MQGRPQVYTPANRPAMGIASFVQAKGRTLGWRGWLYFHMFTDKQMAPLSERLEWMEAGPWTGELRRVHCLPARSARWARCSTRVTARQRGAKIDAKHALVLHVVTFASRLPSASLEPRSRPTCCVCLDDLANRDICCEMKAWGQIWMSISSPPLPSLDGRSQTQECLSPHCVHPSNERLPRHVCAGEKWPFLIRQREWKGAAVTHLSGA